MDIDFWIDEILKLYFAGYSFKYAYEILDKWRQNYAN